MGLLKVLHKLFQPLRRRYGVYLEEHDCMMVTLPNGRTVCIAKILNQDRNSITYIDGSGRIKTIKW